MQHNKITGSDVHVLHAFTYADVTARTAATGFTVEDVGKAALQESDNTLWALTDHDPITWVQIGTGAPPGPHTHTESDVTGLVADLASINSALTDLDTNKADVGHTHPESDITGLVTDLAGKADIGHVHDDRYYTETEVDTLLANKAASTHTHALDDLLDVSTTGATDGQALVYNAGGWAPGTVSGGSGGSVATVRQTALSGRVDSSGFANYLSAGTGLSVDKAATAVPVKLSYGDGSVTETISADVVGAWSGLTANTTCYLYREYGVGYGFTTLVPQYGSAYTPTNVTPTMTSNSAPAPYVASASTEFSSTFAAWKAFDGDTTTHGWIAAATTGWLKLDWGSATLVLKYAVRGSFNNTTCSPKTWTFEGSNDNATWTVLDTQTNITSWTNNESKSYTLSTTGFYRYYRLNITANNGHASEVDVAALDLYGVSFGQHWYDLSVDTMKVWNGSAWQSKQRVFEGEAVTNASAVTSVITYALRGYYDSGRFSVSANTSYAKSHNLGVEPKTVLVSGATAAGGTLYQTIGPWFNSTTSTAEGFGYRDLDRKSVTVRVYGLAAVIGNSSATGSFPRSTAVELQVIVWRGW